MFTIVLPILYHPHPSFVFNKTHTITIETLAVLFHLCPTPSHEKPPTPTLLLEFDKRLSITLKLFCSNRFENEKCRNQNKKIIEIH